MTQISKVLSNTSLVDRQSFQIEQYWFPLDCKFTSINSKKIPLVSFHLYTLSHPENDRDVTERAQPQVCIHDARRILYASTPVFLFERVKKKPSCACGNKRLPPEYALTSRSFSG